MAKQPRVNAPRYQVTRNPSCDSITRADIMRWKSSRQRTIACQGWWRWAPSGMPIGLAMRFHLHVLGTWRHGRRSVNDQVAIVAEPHFQPGQRSGRWTGNGRPVALKRAAVARTSDHTSIRLPGREAPKMGAYRTQRIEAFLRAHDENPEAGIERNRPDGVPLRPADTDDWRGLVEHIWGEISESEHARAQSGHTQRGRADLDELAAIQRGTVAIAGVLLVVFWHRYFKD